MPLLIRQDHPHQYHFDVEAAAKVWGDDNCVAVFDLDWFRNKSLKQVSSQKSGVQCWREAANLEDEIRWQSNKMDGIGESYGLYSLEDQKPTQETSFLYIPPCMGWVICRIQGSQHGPTTQSLPISSECLFGMWGCPFQFSSIHSLWCHFGNWVSIEILWTLHVTCVFFCLNAYLNRPTSTSYFMVTSHHNVIQKPDLARLLALKITVQAWELLIMPSTVLKPTWVWKGRSWIANEMTRECYSQYSFTDIICWVVPPASQDSSGKWR